MKPILISLIFMICLYALRPVFYRWAMRQMAKRVQRKFMDMQNEANSVNNMRGNETTASPVDKKVGKDIGEYVEYEEVK